MLSVLSFPPSLSVPVLTSADVDECSENRCHPSATCYNTPGSFSCRCQAGYHGDGLQCTLGKVGEASLGQRTPSSSSAAFLQRFSPLSVYPGLRPYWIFQDLDSFPLSSLQLPSLLLVHWLLAFWEAQGVTHPLSSLLADLVNCPSDLRCLVSAV